MGLQQFATPNSFNVRGVREDQAFKVKSIIASALGDDFGKNVHKRTHKLDDQEDAVNLMTAILLKFTTDEMKEFVNDEREKRGLQRVNIDKRDIYEFKKMYSGSIDRAYVATATYIGELHPYADKLHRIGLYNHIIEQLAPVRFELMYPDDMIIKKANLLIKAMDRINVEMGGESLVQQLKPREDKANHDEEKVLDKQLDAKTIKAFFDEKYKDQLPSVQIVEQSTTSENESNGEPK